MRPLLIKPAATTAAYTLSLHDALPISCGRFAPASGLRIEYLVSEFARRRLCQPPARRVPLERRLTKTRSEEHTSELQSQFHLVCRLPPEKKKRATPTPAARTPTPPGPL